jgi:hypothetical protein
LLLTIKLGQVWFAYDEDSDLEPLRRAGKMLQDAGINRTRSGHVSHRARCYVLVGHPKDSMDRATQRLQLAYQSGFLPMAMLYRDANGKRGDDWRRFQKYWARPASINRMCRDGGLLTIARRT